MRFVLRFLGICFSLGSGLFLVGVIAALTLYMKFAEDLQDHSELATYEPPVMTRVHAADGSILVEYSRERRLYLPIQSIPDLLKAAFISAEDKNFRNHIGVDPEGVVRAMLRNARSSGREQGASTITQQVAKNFFLTSERSIERKIKEMFLAFKLEAAFTKDHILELYVNQIYLGMSNYGVAAASLDYFNKSVHELTLAEIAYLAALPKAPANYDPFRKKAAAIERRNWVIDRMVANGYVAKDDGEKAKLQPLTIAARRVSPNYYAAGYFAEEVRKDIAERYGEKKLYEGGLSVRTTLDLKMQSMARKALVDGLVRFDESRGWRRPTEQLQTNGREWGVALADVPSLGDVSPWRMAVVLQVSPNGARIGLQPKKSYAGIVDPKREEGIVSAEGAKWTRKPISQLVSVGDIIYVEPIEKKPGEYRLRQIPVISGALVAMDPYTGRVHAMVGGFSFDQSQFNRATQALRQPGSSFKPFVYATALDNGYTPSSVVYDGPIVIDMGGGNYWRPTNYGGQTGVGPKTLRYGIQFSKNLMTIRLAKDIGMPIIAEYARRFGIYDDMLPVLSMSLGAGETTVMRMVTAYAILDNGGKRIKPTLIDRVQDRTGKTIYRHDERKCVGCDAEKWADQNEPELIDNRELVIDPMTAYQITSMMEGVVQRGTAQILKSVGKPIAGKTGTTNDAKDVWFVGYSPNLVVGIYLGYDQPRSLGGRATGGGFAAPIGRDFFTMALKDKPATPFRVPPGMKMIRINAATGMRASSGDGGTIMEVFKPGTAPPDVYTVIGGYPDEDYEGGGGGGGPLRDDDLLTPDARRSLNYGSGGLY